MPEPDYKTMYYHLAGRMAGAVESLEAIIEVLKNAQQTTEEMFMSSGEDDLEKNSEK